MSITAPFQSLGCLVVKSKVEQSTAAAGEMRSSKEGPPHLEPEEQAMVERQRGSWLAKVVLAKDDSPGTDGSSDGCGLRALREASAGK